MLELARLCYGLKVLGDDKPVHNRDEDCGAAASIYEEIHPRRVARYPSQIMGKKDIQEEPSVEYLRFFIDRLHGQRLSTAPERLHQMVQGRRIPGRNR